MDNQSDKLFIKIDNEMITENSKYHLTDKELYLFSILYMDKRRDGTARTSLSIISSLMDISFSNRKERNFKMIKDILYSLEGKEVLSFVNSDGEMPEVEDLRASDYIIIKFKKIAIEENKKSGFAQIFYSEFQKCESFSELYVFAAVKRWENVEGGVFRCDYDRFSRILRVARSTAQRNVDAAVKKKLIYRNTGDYIDNEDGLQKVQALNEYKCVPFNEGEKSIQTKKKEFIDNKYSDESVYDELEDQFYYGDSDLQMYYDDWNRFEGDDGEQYSPSPEAHLIVIEVEENLKHRKPTKMEYKLIDKANWRKGLMLKTLLGEESWHNAHNTAMYDYEVKLGNIDPEVKANPIEDQKNYVESHFPF